MRLAVFADVHAHGDALEAVITGATAARVDRLWFLGDVVGRGPDPDRAAALIRAECAVALAGNHDLAVTGSMSPDAYGVAGTPGHRSIELAARELEASGRIAWLRSLKPAARREGVQCWHASPRHPVREFVGPDNAGACLARVRGLVGLVGHTHAPAAWCAVGDGRARSVDVVAGEPLDLAGGPWLLNPGAVGAPTPTRHGWWYALDLQAADGAWWLELDLDASTATWRRAPFDPAPARERARALGLLEARDRGPRVTR